MMNIPEKILTESDLRQYLTYMLQMLGCGFHPDDPINGYTKEDGTPIFDDQQVVVLERLMEESFDFCEQNGIEIYEVAFDMCKEMYNLDFEE